MGAPSINEIDTAINQSAEGIGYRLAVLIDDHGWWDWSDGSEHSPSERLAVVQSSDAWWCVYAGVEPADATRHASESDAKRAMAKLRSMIES